MFGYSWQVKCLHAAHNPLFPFASGVLYVTNVNINVPLTHFYGFCIIISIAEKACSLVSGSILSVHASRTPTRWLLVTSIVHSLSLCIFASQSPDWTQYLTAF